MKYAIYIVLSRTLRKAGFTNVAVRYRVKAARVTAASDGLREVLTCHST